MNKAERMQKLVDMPLFSIERKKQLSKMPSKEKQAEQNKRFSIAKYLTEKHRRLSRQTAMIALKKQCAFLILNTFFPLLLSVVLSHFTTLPTWLIVIIFIGGFVAIAVKAILNIVNGFLFNKFVDHLLYYGADAENDLSEKDFFN